MLLKQIAEGRCAVENQYQRIVPQKGNHQALEAVAQVFELREYFEWRGLGSIDYSGVRIRDEYARFDAEQRYLVLQRCQQAVVEAANKRIVNKISHGFAAATVCQRDGPATL